MEINNTPDIMSIYGSFIEERNSVNSEERYKGNESWYHASSAGMCTRKIYYSSVEVAEPTNPSDAKAQRLMRLGTIVHNDIQRSLLNFNKEKESSKEKETFSNSFINSTNSSINSTNNTIREIKVEGKVELKELNVRGFFDVVIDMETDEVYLMDIKTIGSYPYKLKFGRNAMANKNSIHQELQLATYGLGVKEQMGRLDGMFLIYYNKDTSMTKTVEVTLDYLELAKSYWTSVHNKLKDATSPPFIEEGISPVMSWECNYCNWKDKCEEDG